jgi:hypothetical protein
MLPTPSPIALQTDALPQIPRFVLLLVVVLACAAILVGGNLLRRSARGRRRETPLDAPHGPSAPSNRTDR